MKTDVWKHNGKVFGYPNCCIEDFCTRSDLSKATEDQIKVGNLGYGFIPCPEHASHIVQGKSIVEI